MTMPTSVESVLAEIEAHVHASGWDRGPALFALVPASQVVADEPAAAARLGIDRLPADALTPIEQDDLPDLPLDELLGSVAWPATVDGCAVTQEIVVLPPSAESELTDDQAAAVAAGEMQHPDRREARIVVGVLRDGTTASLLRLRGDTGEGDDLLTGDDLAPNLAAALLATFDEGLGDG